jgi:hypothetical protein
MPQQVRNIEQILQLIFDANTNTINVQTSGGGGGAGTADSTAANQTTEIARLTSILAKLKSHTQHALQRVQVSCSELTLQYLLKQCNILRPQQPDYLF